MSGASGSVSTDLVIGGMARVDLLPNEVRVAQRGARQRVWLGVAVVAALVVTAGAYGAVKVTSLAAALELSREQDRTVELLAAQSEFSELRTLTGTRQALQDARIAGAYSEIDWMARVAEVQAALPADAVIIEMSLDSGDSMVAYPQPTTPFAAPVTAVMTFTAVTPTVPQVADWLDALETSVTGFSAAGTSGVSWSEETQVYATGISVGVTQGAWSGRYIPDEVIAAAQDRAAEPVETNDETTDAAGETP